MSTIKTPTILAAAVSLITILGCSGLGVGPVEMTAADRALPFTAQELAQTHGTPSDPAFESFTMERELDGSYSLEYQFNHSDSEPILVLSNLLAREQDAGDALITYGIYETVMAVTFASEDIERKPRPELCSLGDRCTCNGIVTEVGEVGTQCVIADGRSVAMVQVIGAVWTEPGEIDTALGPMLDRLRVWEPTQTPK